MSRGSPTCCDRTAAALRAGRAPAPSGCATCQALIAAARLAPVGEPEAFDAGAAFAELEGALAAEAGWRGRLRAWPTWARVLAVVLAALAIGALNAGFAPRPDLAHYPWPRLVLVLGLCFAGVWAAGAGALWPLSRPELKPATAGVLALLGLAIPLALALAPEAPATLPACAPPAGMFRQKAIGCLVFGCLCAVPALLAAATFTRGALSITDGLLVASAGALCGQVALQLHCPIVGAEHQLAGHVPVALALNAAVCLALLLKNRGAR